MSRAKKRVSDGTEKKLRHLKPFKPGQSGNPKGRPKGARNRLGTQFLPVGQRSRLGRDAHLLLALPRIET
jgi:hypothetical protein